MQSLLRFQNLPWSIQEIVWSKFPLYCCRREGCIYSFDREREKGWMFKIYILHPFYVGVLHCNAQGRLRKAALFRESRRRSCHRCRNFDSRCSLRYKDLPHTHTPTSTVMFEAGRSLAKASLKVEKIHYHSFKASTWGGVSLYRLKRFINSKN